MKKQTAQHTQIYPKDSDGHPLAAGYGVIARAVYDAMQHPLNIK
jgi:lysophospholipase L1-like esterase